MDTKYDVFLSYSTFDKLIAEAVCGYLESHQVRCFVAYRDIPKGTQWPKIIPSAIKSSLLMVAIFSLEFNRSEQTDNEISIADKRHIPILTFKIADEDFDGIKEYFLTKSNWIEAFPNPEKHFGQLLNSVRLLLGIKCEDTRIYTHTIITPEQKIADGYLQKGLHLRNGIDGQCDFALSAYYLQKSAKLGNAEAEYYMGIVYYEGNGLPHNWQKAHEWFEKSIEHGYPKAMRMLAKMYHYAIGVNQNIMKALDLYTQAAEAGDGTAMKALGQVYHTGELGVKDDNRSSKYYLNAYNCLYEQALGDNDPEAQYEIGCSYLDGEGIEQDYIQAREWFERAYTNHYFSALNTLGWLYYSGMGVAKDYIKYHKLQLQAAQAGCRAAQRNLAYDYRQGKGVRKNLKLAYEWQLKAANGGWQDAQLCMAIDYLLGDAYVGKDVLKAQQWFEKAINSGSLSAMVKYGIAIEEGEIKVDNAYEKAFLLYKKAAVMNYYWAFYSLGNCYYYGQGTEKNYTHAFRWYSRIADIYTEMLLRGEDHFLSYEGAGTIRNSDFNNNEQAMFAQVFENLAWIYRNGKGIERDNHLAQYWDDVAKKLPRKPKVKPE
ncbi:TPR repeat [Prevotella communis]|uniref:TPR repeat n=1 Tax=Prevotella communis TaxID=2913614 RepID=A0A1H0FQG3_9BACT|nr:TIR domain-containing protein [Prevotella communis]SDN96923.1 TPR repeat [Prevotella communis]